MTLIGSLQMRQQPGMHIGSRRLDMRDDDVTERLHKVAQHDWENSRPLDLTDQGLLADLEEHYADSAEKLALAEHHQKHK